MTIIACCLVALGTIRPAWGDWLPEQRVSQCLGQCDPTGSNQTAIAVDADNHVHVIWLDGRNASSEDATPTNEVYYRKYTPGEGWDWEVRLTFRELARPEDEAKDPAPISVGSLKGSAGVVVDSENNVYVSFENRTHETANVVRIDGESGEPGEPEVLGEAGVADSNPGLAVDDDNYVHAVWVGMDGDWPQIFYRKYKPGGGWGTEERLTSHESHKRRPALAVDGAGTVHLVWEDSRCGYTTESEDIDYGICYTERGGETWTNLTDLIGSFDAERPHIVADAAGDLHVAWADNRPEHGSGNFEIYYRRFDGASDEWMPEKRISDAPWSSNNPHLAVDPSRQVHLLWLDINEASGQLAPFYAKKTTDWGDRVRLARAGHRASLVAGPDSRLHVAYRASVSGRGQQVHYLEYDPALVAEMSAREVMLTVDVSGSMGWSEGGAMSVTPEETRLYKARQALSNFVDRFQLRNPTQAEFGLVSFPDPGARVGSVPRNIVAKTCNSSAAVVVPLTALTETSRDKAITVDIPGLEVAPIGAGSTPLVEGLTVADQLMTTSSEHGVILLVSDGRHNCPEVDFPADFPYRLKHPVYASGVGTATEVDPRLADVAAETGGGYVNATTETQQDLMTWAKDVIVTILGLEAEIDPPGQIKFGETLKHPAWITDHDTDIAFGLSWAKPSKNRIGFTLRGPGDVVITPLNAEKLAGVTHVSRPTYQIYYLGEEFLKGIKRAGAWTLELTGRQLDRTAVENYQYDVTMASSLKMLPEFNRNRYRTGEEIGLQVVILEGGRRIPAEVYVEVRQPQQGIGNWFAAHSKGHVLSSGLDTKEVMGDSTTLTRVEKKIRQERGAFPAVGKGRKMQLVDDGTQWDLSEGDRIYSTVFKNTEVPGTYSFDILATGKTSTGQPFRRHRVIQRQVVVNVQPSHTAVAMAKVNDDQFELTITPTDAWGNRLGPGYADHIAFVIDGARSLSPLKDRVDGSYSQRFSLTGSAVGDCTPVRARVRQADMIFCARLVE